MFETLSDDVTENFELLSFLAVVWADFRHSARERCESCPATLKLIVVTATAASLNKL
jgi:hypothetical protein